MAEQQFEFVQLYQQYRPKILAYLTRLAGPDAAEELCQDAFLKVEQGLGSFRGESQLSTWIYRIATNCFRDQLRCAKEKQRQRESVPLADQSPQLVEQNVWTREPAPKIDQQVIRAEMNDCIRGYIDRLPEDYRAALLLSDVEGFKNREIAEILQISLENVKIRLHRARRMLKESLQSHCSFYLDERSELACDRKQADSAD